MAPISCRVKATQFAKVSLLRLWPYHFLPSSSPTQLQPLSPPCCSWNKPSTLLPQGLCTCWSAPRILFPQGAAWLFLPRSLHKCHLFSELILLSITCKRAKPPSPVLVSPLCTCPGRSPSQHVFWVVAILRYATAAVTWSVCSLLYPWCPHKAWHTVGAQKRLE